MPVEKNWMFLVFPSLVGSTPAAAPAILLGLMVFLRLPKAACAFAPDPVAVQDSLWHRVEKQYQLRT